MTEFLLLPLSSRVSSVTWPQLICATLPRKQNHCVLVNHYHTQLIIPWAYVGICSMPSTSPPFPHAIGLTSSHPGWHPLVARRRGLPFLRSPGRLGNTGVTERPRRHPPPPPPPLHADDKVSISALHLPPGYKQTDRHVATHRQIHMQHTRCSRWGNDHLTLRWPQRGTKTLSRREGEGTRAIKWSGITTNGNRELKREESS